MSASSPAALGKFNPIDHIPPAEEPSADYPMVMSTGRVLYHWHGGQMTRRSKGLMEVYGEALIEVNPDDAAKLGLNGKKIVRVIIPPRQPSKPRPGSRTASRPAWFTPTSTSPKPRPMS